MIIIVNVYINNSNVPWMFKIHDWLTNGKFIKRIGPMNSERKAVCLEERNRNRT